MKGPLCPSSLVTELGARAPQPAASSSDLRQEFIPDLFQSLPSTPPTAARFLSGSHASSPAGPLGSQRSLPLASPTPCSPVSLPGPVLFPFGPFHPDPDLSSASPPASCSRVRTLLPSGAPSPSTHGGLAARPLSQQSCSLSSSACGRLASQSRPRASLGALPRGLLENVVHAS